MSQVSHRKLKFSISHPPFSYDWEKIFVLKIFFKKFSHKNIEKLLSKAAHNRHNFFFSTANWLKSSSNLNFCSIKNAHVTTYLCIMTLGWVNYKSLYQLGLFSLKNHMFQLQVIIYSIEYIRGIQFKQWGNKSYHVNLSQLLSLVFSCIDLTSFLHLKLLHILAIQQFSSKLFLSSTSKSTYFYDGDKISYTINIKHQCDLSGGVLRT